MKTRKKHRVWTVPAAIAGVLILTCLYKLIFIAGADMVIRYDFTGIENMFHPPHYYYAVIGSSSTWVPSGVVKAFHPDWDLEKSLYDDLDDNYYYATILYSPEGVYDIKGPVIDIGKGNEFVATYREWTKKTDPLSPEMLDLLRNMIMDNYDFDSYFIDEDEGWSWRSGDRYGLDGFLMIAPKGVSDRAILDSDDKVCMIKDGKMSKIMNCPGNGSCEYVYFTDRW